MRATIKDVAKETGLAMSTISKYINGGSVKPQNKILIEKVIKRLGYIPNTDARGLRANKTFTVGILVSDLEDQHIIDLITALEGALREAGYFSIVCCHRDSLVQAQEAIQFLLSRQVDGVVLEGLLTKEEYTNPFRERNIPSVWLETIMESWSNDAVVSDGTWGSYQAVEKLVVSGHRKIAIINGPNDYFTAKERMRGYLRVFEDYMLPIRKEYIVESDYHYKGGYQSMEYLWNLADRPTAVFVSNYHMCMGVMSAVSKLHIKVPHELSIFTYDDMDFSYLVRPHLSAVKQPFDEMAKEAAKVLVRRINGDYLNYPEMIRLKTEVKYRNSVSVLKE